jgi:hypothetical protein
MSAPTNPLRAGLLSVIAMLTFIAHGAFGIYF